MPTYAKNTEVPVEKSQAEIRHILARYKATGFMFAEKGDQAVVAFSAQGRNIVLPVPMPKQHSAKIIASRYPTSMEQRAAQQRADAHAANEYAGEVRQRWRVLILLLKAKLEAIELGLSTFGDEFLPYTMLPSGRTVSQELKGQIEHMMITGQVPNLVPMLGDGKIIP